MKRRAKIMRPIQFIGILLVAFLSSSACSSPVREKPDSILSQEIQRQLVAREISGLYYPKSLTRFYNKLGFQSPWIKPQNEKGQTWQGMLVLDCVLQFGLAHSDYHPNELLYDKLHDILDTPGKVSIKDQARFDILLTDAMLNIINNLHFGKLNPEFSAGKIDKGDINGFHAEETLMIALNPKKDFDFLGVIASVQPKSKEYIDLQYHMRLLTGSRQGDCYEIPESNIRLMAINMERLRWAAIDDSTYIQVNIPSYNLQFHQPNATNEFKVIIGKPATPTPTLNSTIGYFTTGPDWTVPKKIFVRELLPKALKDSAYLGNNHFSIYTKKGNSVTPTRTNLLEIRRFPEKYFARQSSGCDNALGAVVFRFPNIYDIYLHDTPEQQLFNREDRAFSHGCIRVENAEKLAALLLKNDNAETKVNALHEAMAAYQNKTFNLKKPVPVKVTYLTCLVIAGELISYKDVYNLDNSLEMALYNTYQHNTYQQFTLK
jgi:murein L,D-transpeptidase YcbB/YkuD